MIYLVCLATVSASAIGSPTSGYIAHQHPLETARTLSAKEVAQGLANLAPLLRSQIGSRTHIYETARAKLDSELERLTLQTGASLKQVAEAFHGLGKDGDWECSFLFGLYFTRQIKPSSVGVVLKTDVVYFSERIFDAKSKRLSWPWAEIEGRPTLVVRAIRWPFGSIIYSISGWWGDMEHHGILKHMR